MRMKRWTILPIVYLSHFLSAISVSAEWMDVVIRNIVDEFVLHQVVVFTMKKDYSTFSANAVYTKIIAQMPSITINIFEISPHETNRVSELIFKNPEDTLYIIFQNERSISSQEFREILNYVSTGLDKLPRPKCLGLFFENSSDFTGNFQPLFLYAWSLKFIDFVILKIDKSIKSTIVLDYNPFTELYGENKFTNTKHLFSDKFKNMNGHPLQILQFNKEPYVCINKCSYNKDSGGIDYTYIKLLSKVLNFSINLIPNENNAHDLLYEKWEKGDINVTTLTWSKKAEATAKNVLIGRALSSEQLGMLVPVLHVIEVNSLLNLLKPLILSSFLLFIIHITTSLLKFSSIDWSYFYIFQIIFGFVTTKKPQHAIERLVFLSITIASLAYCSQIIAIIADNKVLTFREVSFDALEQLDHPQLPIYINKLFVDSDVNENLVTDNVTLHLQVNAKKVTDVAECLHTLVEKKDRICIAPTAYAKFYALKLRNPDNTPTMKLIQPFFYLDYVAFGYAKASPLMFKFDKMFQFLIESGIPGMWLGKYRFKLKDTKDAAFKTESFLTECIIVLSVGYGISFLAFLIELTNIRSLARYFK